MLCAINYFLIAQADALAQLKSSYDRWEAQERTTCAQQKEAVRQAVDRAIQEANLSIEQRDAELRAAQIQLEEQRLKTAAVPAPAPAPAQPTEAWGAASVEHVAGVDVAAQTEGHFKPPPPPFTLRIM